MSPVLLRRWRWLVLLLLSGLLGGVLQALHFPAGVLLGCMVAAILMSVQWGRMDLPKPFFMLAYAMIGWSAGLRFTRDILLQAWQALPMVLAAISVLMELGLVLALLLVMLVEPMGDRVASLQMSALKLLSLALLLAAASDRASGQARQLRAKAEFHKGKKGKTWTTGNC